MLLGEREGLPATAARVASRCEKEQAAGGSRLHLNIALNYGGRREILQAVQKLAAKVEVGKLRAAD